MRKEMFKGAAHLIFQRAKELRNHVTDAERILRMHLRDKQMGYKFRRQHPIGNYIADFYCHQLKLIEADGSVHNNDEVKKKDIERQLFFESTGIKVIRFTNDDIRFNIEKVLSKVNSEIYGSPK